MSSGGKGPIDSVVVPHRVKLPAVRGLSLPNGVSARLKRMQAILIGLVVFGVVLRLATFQSWGIVYDGAEYAVMGESFVRHGEFIVPYASGIQYYHHYGPLYPAVLAVFYAAFGFDMAVTKVAGLALSILFIAVVFLTTKDLLGPWKAWFAAAFVALDPLFFIATAIGYSEDLVGLLFVATVWAVLKGVRHPRFLVLAGVLAGLGFLAKASIGTVFVLAGVVGLLWRMRYYGRGVLRDRYYIGGIAAFGVLVGGWTLRNLARFGWPNFDTSATVDAAYTFGLAHPNLLAFGLVAKAPWFLLMFLFYGGLFLPELRRSLRRVREEETSAVWLAVVLVFVIGWIVSSFFWTVERTPIWWHDNLRYVVIAFPVLLWAALREVSPYMILGSSSRPSLWSFRTRFLGLMTVFLVIGMVLVAFPAPYSHIAAVQDMERYLRPGDAVAVDGLSLEGVIPYLSSAGVRVVAYHAGFDGAFVLSANSNAYRGFVLLASYRGQDLTGWTYASDLWANATLVARGR